MTSEAVTITDGWTITDGPPRDELFDSLRLRDEYRSVEFEFCEPAMGSRGVATKLNPIKVRLKAQILKVGADDGSGHSWNLKIAFDRPKGVSVTNSDPIDIYYHDAGNRDHGGRRHGSVIDARPYAEKLTIDRDGTVFKGGSKITKVEV